MGYPGAVTRLTHKLVASAATIYADADVIVLSGAVQVNNIVGPNPNIAKIITVIPTGVGGVVFGTTGNILVGATVAQNRPCDFLWNPIAQKWHVGPIS